jgi:hypothetical protein
MRSRRSELTLHGPPEEVLGGLSGADDFGRLAGLFEGRTPGSGAG